MRELSGAGMLDCKEALVESNGDVEKATEALRKKGLAKAVKHQGRETAVGRVFSYIHTGGNIGVLLQLNCETDFVARNQEFETLGKELSMQVAATNPLAVDPQKLDTGIVERERKIFHEQLKKEGKKEEIMEKILNGKMSKFYSEVCLIEQQYIKDSDVKIEELIRRYISKLGENITVARFARYQVS